MCVRTLVLLLGLLYNSDRAYSKDLSQDDGGFVEDDETAQKGNQEAAFLPDLVQGTGSSSMFNPCPGHATGLAGESFAELINTLLMSQCMLAAPCTYPRDIGSECKSTTVFDFIVVGAGTAGSVLAARLTEVSDWNVLLMEAGGDPTITSEIPRFYQNLQRGDLDWGFTTASEKGLYNGLMSRVNRWPRGKVLGGTSTIGSMLYTRGSPRDYDNLAAEGNVGWSYEDVFPYFLKSEDMRDYKVLRSPLTEQYHSRGGPLALSRFGVKDPVIDIIQNACQTLGYPPNFDINGANFAGLVSPNQGTVRTGERLSTFKAFINPIKWRKNLFVIKHAFATRVMICPSTMRAYAVEYHYRNEHAPRIARASREIIVCAGVVNTPKILMLSGLGPRNDMTVAGIHTLKNLRVGRNLADHVMFPGAPISFNSGVAKMTPLDVLDSSYEYLTRRTGPLATIGVSELVGYINVDNDDAPDVQLQFMYASQGDQDALTDFVKAIALEEDIALQLYAIQDKADLLIPLIMIMSPISRGVIGLASNDSEDMPVITAGYMNHPNDLENMMTGIKFVERLANCDAMAPYNASVEYLNYQGCCGLDQGSDFYWACAISHVAGTGNDQTGTAKMGTASDPDAVVDPQLRVYGVRGLRVADASIIPNPMLGSPLAAVIMIGEKAADLIKLCWLPSYDPWTTTRSPFRTTTPPPTRKSLSREFHEKNIL